MKAFSKTHQFILWESLYKGCCWFSKSSRDENRDGEDGVVFIIKICKFQYPKIQKLADLSKKLNDYITEYQMTKCFLRDDYIAYPVVQVIIRESAMFGDKLLVSTSFMISHIYKFHNTGFSWRNLEHTPELLEINKTPELRDFIGSIIGFLKQTHLSSIESGLYLFKFPMKITEEISFQTKQSEELSALFNFSLDESLSVKKHYTDRLKYYLQLQPAGQKEMHALASIYHILADIYLADEDYSQAIFEYQSGLQSIFKQIENKGYDEDAHWVSNMLFFIRCTLKLGLTYEKRKTYNSAYLAYSELVDRLVDYRHLKEKDIALQFEMKNTNDARNKYAILFQKPSVTEDKNDNSETFRDEIRPELWDPDTRRTYSINSFNLRSELSHLLTPKKSSIIMRLSLFEEIRLVYLASLAKLFVLEKMERGGITQTNLDVTESEFFYLHISTDMKEKFLACADFHHKLGTILYYKNGLVDRKKNNLFRSFYYWGFDVKNAIEDFCAKRLGKNQGKNYYDDYANLKMLLKDFLSFINYKDFKVSNPNYTDILIKNCTHYILTYHPKDSGNAEGIIKDFISSFEIPSFINIKKVIDCIEHRDCILANGYHLPCHACKCYNISLKVLFNNALKIEPEHNYSKAQTIIKFMARPSVWHEWATLRSSYTVLIASVLEGLGNTLVCCSHHKDQITSEFLETFFTITRKYHDKEEHQLEWNTNLSHLEKAILYYWSATAFFSTSGNLNSAFRCNKRILEVLCSYVESTDQPAFIIPFMERIKDYIVKRALIKIYSHYEHINISEVQKLKWMYKADLFEDIDLHLLSLFPDIEEVLYSFFRLRINSGITQQIPSLYNSILMSPHRLVSTLAQDIQNLRFKTMMNAIIIQKLLPNVNEDSIFERTLPINFYKSLTDLFLIVDVDDLLGDCQNALDVSHERLPERIKMLEFLICDSIYCLTSILKKIVPLNYSTLFTHSFIGNQYKKLLYWNYMFECLYFFKKGIDNMNVEVIQGVESLCSDDPLIDKLINLVTDGKGRDSEESKQRQAQLAEAFIDSVRTGLCDILPTQNSAQTFTDHLIRLIGQDSFQMLVSNYLSEAAIKQYFKAKEMHTEGYAYKDMIGNLYFLDDDLENDTCQFWFAQERYRINRGAIDELIKKLKSVTRFSSIYDADKYF